MNPDNQSSKIIVTSKQHNKSKKLRFVKASTALTAVVVLIILSAGVGAWLLSTNKVVVVWNDFPPTSQVCGGDIKLVGKFNDAMTYRARGESKELSYDAKGLNDLDKEVSSRDGYQGDPTCQTIRFLIAVQHNNYGQAKEFGESVVNLHAQGEYADSNLSGNSPISVYPEIIYSTSPEAQTAPES